MRKSILALGLVLGLVPLTSHAGLIVQVSDGTNTVNIADGSAFDGALQAGTVTFADSFVGWTVAGFFAKSVAIPLTMNLTAIVSGDRSDGQLWIRFTHTDLDAGAGPVGFNAEGSGTAGASGILADWAAYVDDNNTAFGAITMIASGSGFGGASGASSVSLSGTYSATLVTHFDYRGAAGLGNFGSNLDVGMAAVPEPSSMALLALGGLGLFGVARRRYKV